MDSTLVVRINKCFCAHHTHHFLWSISIYYHMDIIYDDLSHRRYYLLYDVSFDYYYHRSSLTVTTLTLVLHLFPNKSALCLSVYSEKYFLSSFLFFLHTKHLQFRNVLKAKPYSNRYGPLLVQSNAIEMKSTRSISPNTGNDKKKSLSNHIKSL